MTISTNFIIHSGHTDASPLEAGYNPEKIRQLDSLLLDLITSKKLQSAGYALSRYGKTFACKSMGKLTYQEDSDDYMPDSLRRIASLTKVFTAVAVMKLFEEGKLYLDQTVNTIIDEFNTDMHKKITMFHLLTHTSGIMAAPGYFCEPYTRNWWQGMDETDGNSNWIKAALAGPLQSKPGEKWNYCSLGFMLLGEIISRVSGMHCEDYIIENIVKPLGMTDTFFDVPEHLYGRVCCTHEWDKKRLKSTEAGNNRLPRTSGGIYSNISDLTKLGQMLLNKGELNGVRILGRKTVEAMTRNHLDGVPAFNWGEDLKEFKYGLGLSLTKGDLLSPGTFNHEGAGRCALYVDPEESFVAVFFTPTNIAWVPESLIGTKAIIWSGIL